MSYPSCKHGNADPNHECQQCATECVISDLTTECRTLRVELAQVTKERDEAKRLVACAEVRQYLGLTGDDKTDTEIINLHRVIDELSVKLRAERDAALAQLAKVRSALATLKAFIHDTPRQ